MRQEKITVIGAGLAGSEAAWQIANQRISVDLFEMRPQKKTEAHQTPFFSELVCSNSFGSEVPASASCILKEELQRLDAFILGKARAHRVQAGASLAVDRLEFASAITQSLEKHPLITIHREAVSKIPLNEIVIIATGPLTSSELSQDLSSILGETSLYFYDAISPIVSDESLDKTKLYFASRYGKGDPDFSNLPLDEEEYHAFVDLLLSGEVVLPHNFEEAKYFESCLPIETIAARGRMSLAFGPMKPVGLNDPKTGKRPFAVIQLRTENRYKTAYNLVGFQTKLKYKEQERIFRTLPGLQNAEFLRLGSMHRNTYLNSPKHLLPTLQLRKYPNIFIAGQLTGTEGYLESSATGLLAGKNAVRLAKGLQALTLPVETMLGALIHSITDSEKENFQPTNVNMGLLPPLNPRPKDKQTRNLNFSNRALGTLSEFLSGAV